MTRLPVIKTYKLFIGGQFPRSESGRSQPLNDCTGRTIAHLCRASRKDLRDAVEAARHAQPKWAALSGYNRGQILYRMAEMLEGRAAQFIEAIESVEGTGEHGSRSRGARNHNAQRLGARRRSSRAAAEAAASVDRLVGFAGWCDKYAQVMGCQNLAAGPYDTFTTPEPMGVVGIVAPDNPSLLGLVSLLAAALCPGNACVALTGEANPLPAVILGEVLATSDLPPGVVNILTGTRAELLEPLATHREVNAISAAGLNRDEARTVRTGMAENLKRVRVIERPGAMWHDHDLCHAPAEIEPLVEFKTIWHPAAC